MANATLACKEMTKFFGHGSSRLDVLHAITVEFQQPLSYAIMGVSGTGKSTFMHLLAGLDKPTKGSVWFNNLEVNAMSPHEHQYFLNRSVGLLFQQPHLIKELSVLENVMMPALLAGMPREKAEDEACALLVHVGLGNKKTSKPSALSGGQQQRVALARALINRPKFLLADEPTGNLDEETGREIVELLLQLQKDWDMGIIISTHDPHVANRMDYRLRLEDGKLVFED